MDLRHTLHLLFRLFVAFFLAMAFLIAGSFFYTPFELVRPTVQGVLFTAGFVVWFWMILAFCLHFLLPQRMTTTESKWVLYGRYWRHHFFAGWATLALLMAAIALTWPDE